MRSPFLIAFLILIASPQAVIDAQYHPSDMQGLPFSQAKPGSKNVTFTKNLGQWDPRVIFRAETGRASLFFCRGEVDYFIQRNMSDSITRRPDFQNIADMLERPRRRKEGILIRARFIGANPRAEVIGERQISSNRNYFLGADPARWRTHVPSYSEITHKNIYPDIDLRYFGYNQSLKYEFIVHPGADPSSIQIEYDGIESLAMTKNGEIRAQTKLGAIYEKAPVAYQEVNGKRHKVECRYVMKGPNAFGFVIDEAYDPAYSLIIDPQLLFSTYLGGDAYDCINDIDRGKGTAVDLSGNVYITGQTSSSDFPVVNPYDGSYNENYDVFIAKMSSDGSELLYSTYLGGSDYEEGNDIACNALGQAFIVGWTASTDFPTANAYDISYNGGSYDIFAARLSDAGALLIYSTYLGGAGSDGGFDVAIDESNNAYLTGETTSPNFPMANPYDASLGGYVDAFVAKLSSAGNELIYSTYLGGNIYDMGSDLGFGIAVDGSGNAYVAGYTGSTDFPVANAYDGSYNGGGDIFVTKMSYTGGSLLYSTYFGGSGYECGRGIAVNNSAQLFITGETMSSNFPVKNAYSAGNNGGYDIFATRFEAQCESLLYSTYIGGGGDDEANDIIIDNLDYACITGRTGSLDFPVFNPYDRRYNGNGDAFVVKLISSGNHLLYSSYLGGNDNDFGYGIGLDGAGYACIAGCTFSSNFPVHNAYDGDYNGQGDIFISKMDVNAGHQVLHVSIDGSDVTGDGSFARPFSTIQHAINAAADSDIIIVLPGTYHERINFLGKGILVTSNYYFSGDTTDIANTIIDGDDSGTVVIFNNDEDRSSVIKGFTIRNGRGYNSSDAGGILCSFCSPMIEENYIISNIGVTGAGISCFGSQADITGNKISANQAIGPGGGVFCFDSAPSIKGNIIFNNSSESGGGIGLSGDSDPFISFSTIYGNSGSQNGGGISCRDYSTPAITNMIIWGNYAPSGAQIFVDYGLMPQISYSDIQGAVWQGDGNISQNPIFMNATIGDFRLQAGSPCIDMGNPEFPLDPDGSGCDMGALIYDHRAEVSAQIPQGSGDTLIFYQGGVQVARALINNQGDLDSLLIIKYGRFAPDFSDPFYVNLQFYYAFFAFPEAAAFDLNLALNYSQEDLDLAGIGNAASLRIIIKEDDGFYWDIYPENLTERHPEELYIAANNVNHLFLASVIGDSAEENCNYIVGDINGNGVANGLDVVYGVNFFKGGPAPPGACYCPPSPPPFYAAGDVNGSCTFNGLDIVYFVTYLKGGSRLTACPDCPPIGFLAMPSPPIIPVVAPVPKFELKISKPGGDRQPMDR
jgi:hypothetical protein